MATTTTTKKTTDYDMTERYPLDFEPASIEDITKVKEIYEYKESYYKPVLNANGEESQAILDVLLNTVRVNLDALFKSGTIRKEEYAQAYVALYQSTLQTALQFLSMRNLLPRQARKEEETIRTYMRQREGYDEDYMIKSATMFMDSYVSFLTSMPNTPNQPYPSLFTGFYELNSKFQKNTEIDKNNSGTTGGDTNWEAPNKLAALDGIMGKILERLNRYQKEEPNNPNGIAANNQGFQSTKKQK